MKHLISIDDRKFVSQIETCKFPVEAFNHRAHLKLAYVYLAEHNVKTTYELTRNSILSLLKHNNIDTMKFHVTLTLAWILAVRHFMALIPASNSADAFIDSKPLMLDSQIMMTHYTKEKLFSDQARTKFVRPNLDPIPIYSN